MGNFLYLKKTVNKSECNELDYLDCEKHTPIIDSAEEANKHFALYIGSVEGLSSQARLEADKKLTEIIKLI